jgi:hypothetical protein
MNDTRPAQFTGLDPAAFLPLAGIQADLDMSESVMPALPTDHPQWQRDVLSISSRARAAIAELKPLALKVLTYWDHQLRGLVLGTRRLDVDPSGCYRLR